MLILYSADPANDSALIQWLEKTPFQLRVVGPQHTHHTMEHLLTETYPYDEQEPSVAFNAPFLYLDIEEKELEVLLKSMREDNHHLRFKAKRTPNNLHWTLGYLLEHVAEEAKEMELLHLLHRHRQVAAHLEVRPTATEDERHAFTKACADADALLKDVGKRETPSQEIQAVLDALIASAFAVMADDE